MYKNSVLNSILGSSYLLSFISQNRYDFSRTQKVTNKEELKFYQNSKKPKKSLKEAVTEEKQGIEAEVAAYIKEVNMYSSTFQKL